MLERMEASTLRRRWLSRGLIFGLWTFLGLFSASQAIAILYSARRAPPEIAALHSNPSWIELLTLSLAECYVWAILAWFIFRLANRFPLGQGQWRRGLAVHVPASIAIALLESGISTIISEFLRRDLPKPSYSFEVLQLFFVAKFHQNVFIYWVILLVSQAVGYYRKYRERELRASRLEARLAEARLQVLKMQLHPHFLFNTLNAISALMHEDVELADRMIARLGDLLRTTLENANKQEIPLQQEVDFIRPYLEIEQARLGSRLTVRMDIDPGAMDARVPNLILQPLVENAIRHGIAPRPGPGLIEISARRAGDQLQLRVHDDGPGLANPQLIKEGVGLGNTRARLQQLYGTAHGFELTNGQGFTVRVTLPFRETAAENGTAVGGQA
jgi:signal transduction histidine kinase